MDNYNTENQKRYENKENVPLRGSHYEKLDLNPNPSEKNSDLREIKNSTKSADSTNTSETPKKLRLKSLETQDLGQPYPVINPNPPPPSPELVPICHYQTSALDVIEDFYGSYTDNRGKLHHIKRFTWRNYNKLTVQVINYGARIVTMKAPDKNGNVVDVLLGFDDLGGHLRYHKFPLGGCLGRCGSIIKKGTFSIDHNRYTLTLNENNHHYKGGFQGFDRAIWTPYVNKSKVVMTYVSADKEEGYPGQLFVKLTFELCKKNEFRVDYEAHCTKPTIANLTHLCYFNLAGSNQGYEEMYNHILTLNCNCYTVQDEENIPTGEIKNVVNSRYDFQIPKCLSKVIGITPGDGYDQNLCVNTGVEDHDCFVARLYHPPSGRMMEIYSSHRGVNFSTGNEFGTGKVISVDKLLKSKSNESATSLIVKHIYSHLTEHLAIDNDNIYFELRTLIDLVKGAKLNKGKETLSDIVLTKSQYKYLENTLKFCSSSVTHKDVCIEIQNAIQAILNECKIEESTTSIETLQLEGEETRKKIISVITDYINNSRYKEKKYDDQKIHGKHNYIYGSHCGVALTPGNYPNAINTKDFPNAILRPGEVYKHTTCFKFWIRGGNPNNWIKRKVFERNYRMKSEAREEDISKANAILKAGGINY